MTIKGSDKSAATIKSVEDFARLAVTWETNGVFKGVSDNKWSSMEITLASDIDLTGTGIYGLTREGRPTTIKLLPIPLMATTIS